jgi:flagellar biosynthetic protein FliR
MNGFWAALARVGPVVAISPSLGGFGALPVVRIIVAVALAALLGPSLELQSLTGAMLAREVLVGLLLGLVAAAPFWAARAAGLLAGGRPLGDGFGLLALAVFAALGGPRLACAALADSWSAVPVTGPAQIFAAGRTLFESAALLAAPALGALLVADLALGLWSRARGASDDGVYPDTTAPRLALAVAVVALTLGLSVAVLQTTVVPK